ncbi:MAG: efflux RND transporter periplasmic adaptor subunit [Burkholderiales bacterium]|nr:efflux RND transporter periplasmic adaptor subunit [Burkholderiales bacterium]
MTFNPPRPAPRRRRVRHLAATFVAALVVGLPVVAQPTPGATEAPSVLIQSQPLVRRTLGSTLTGYGIVAAAASQVQTLAVASASRVRRILVSPGQTVKRGALLAEVTLDPTAMAATEQARSTVGYAQAEVVRVEGLLADRLATQRQLAAARKALTDAELALRTQQRLTGAPVQRVTAPFDGIVVGLNAAQGDPVAANAPILQVARGDGGRVHLGIEPEDSRRVTPGMHAQVTSVFGDDPPVDAVVVQVLGMINPQTQLVDVVVALPAAATAHLLPGTRVRGDIVVQTVQGYAVPRQAVLRDAQGWYVYQVVGGKARRVAVKPGIEARGQVAIEGALDAAAQVVTLGNYELKDGMAVREAAR